MKFILAIILVLNLAGILNAAASSDILFVGGNDGSLQIWNVLGTNLVKVIPDVHNGQISTIKLLNDGRHLLTESVIDRKVKIWLMDQEHTSISPVCSIQTRFGAADLDQLSNGTIVLTDYNDMLLYNPLDCQFVNEWKITGPSNSINLIRLLPKNEKITNSPFTQDIVLTVTLDSYTYLWDASTGTQISQTQFPYFQDIESLAVSKKFVFRATAEGRVLVEENSQALAELDRIESGDAVNSIDQLRVLSDNRYGNETQLVSVNYYGRLCIFTFSSEPYSFQKPQFCTQIPYYVRDVAVVNDELFVVLLDKELRFMHWMDESRLEQRRINLFSKVYSLAYVPRNADTIYSTYSAQSGTTPSGAVDFTMPIIG